MKNKLLIFFAAIALCAAIQLKMNFASEKQTWTDYFRSKWTELTSSRQAKLLQERAPLVAVTGLSAKLGSYAGLIPSGYIKWLGMSFPITLVIVGLVYTIDSIISKYKTKSVSKTDAILEIKNTLIQTLNNTMLYPTRSSKIHALLKKDEFLQYINDPDSIVQEACNTLIEEIKEQAPKETDQAIDTKMTEIRNKINQYTTIDDQITALETNPEMQAYFSIYFRLKNKQEVENKLSSEEKASRQAERSELQKAKEFLEKRAVSEPEVD